MRSKVSSPFRGKLLAFVFLAIDGDSALDLLVRNHAWILASEYVNNKQRSHLKSSFVAHLSSSLDDWTETMREKVEESKKLSDRFVELIDKKKQWMALALQDPGWPKSCLSIYCEI